MIPGLGGMNPAQMKAMMRQFGIKSEELDATKATIELVNGKKIVFDSPQITVVDMKGQKTYTLVGEAIEEKENDSTISKEDIELVIAQTHVSEEKARDALEKSSGDIAEAIASLKEE
ncbi:MAG: nascent polypeptide-associated complex protein [Candidatus Diapherotrites archaeon]